MVDMFSFCLFLHAITIMFTLTVATNSFSMQNETFVPNATRWCRGRQAGQDRRALECRDTGHGVQAWADKKKGRG